MAQVDVQLNGHIQTSSEVELNQCLCTLIDAKLAAREFPGLRIEPNQDGSFAIIHSVASGFDRKHVSIERLVVQVYNTVMELQAVYGESAEKLFATPLQVELKEH